MSDPGAQSAIDYFKRKVEAHMAKIAEWQRSANEIAAENGMPPAYDSVVDGSTMTAISRLDQFAKFATPSTAARSYLESRKTAATLDQIFAALKDGGYQFTDSDVDARASLKIALGKDGKVRPLGNGAYGLWEWYPDVKRAKVTAKGAIESDEPDDFDGKV